MPAYDYECPEGHINEHFLSKFAEHVQCEDCELTADYRPSFYYTSAAAPTEPTYIHKDAFGNVRFVLDKNAPIPPGFELQELRGSHAIHKFEKEINDRDQAKAREFHAANEAYRQGQIAENRRVMKEFHEGKSWTDSNGELRHGLSPRGRKFYEAMREQSERRTHAAKNPEFYVEAYSMNSSNREAYQSGGRFERGRK